jgi:hypothetical protein
MATKDDAQRLLELAEKIKKLEARKKQLEFRTREKERKERTRRLIQIGAIMDSMGIDSVELTEKFKTYFMNTPKSKEWLDSFISKEEIL